MTIDIRPGAYRSVDMGKLKGLWLLVATLSFANAADTLTKIYFQHGGTLALKPSVDSTDPIENIVWRVGENLVAEWIESGSLFEYYSTFENRTHLDVNTGSLTIRNMTEADQGVYKLEINGKPQAVRYEATLIAKLLQPEVLIRPLTCSDTSDRCNVSCAANTVKAGPVSYSWMFGADEWKELSKEVAIEPNTHGHAEVIRCRIKNPISEETSEPVHNPFYKPSTTHPAAWVVPVVILLLVFCGLCGLGVLWRLKKFPFKNRGMPVPQTELQPAEKPPTLGDQSNTPPEERPLNDKSPDAAEAT